MEAAGRSNYPTGRGVATTVRLIYFNTPGTRSVAGTQTRTMIRNLLIALWLSGSFACTPASQPATPLSPFFDLTSFFEAEITRLMQRSGPVSKTTRINGTTETRTLPTLDYRTELAPFIAADINRPAWLDKYRVDSLVTDGRLRKLTYTALEEDLFTRQLVVAFGNAGVDSIVIQKGSDLMIADTRRELVYRPASGYRLSGTQRVVLASNNRIGIEVNF